MCVCVCIKCVCFPLCKYPMYCGARSTLQKPPLLQALVVSGLPQRSCFGGATGSPEPPVWGDVGTCLTHIYRTVYIYIYYLTRNKKTGSFTDALELFEVLWFYNALYIYIYLTIGYESTEIHWAYFNTSIFATNLLAPAHSTQSEAFSHPMLSPEHINGTCMRMLYGHLFWYAKGFLLTCWKCSHRGVLLGSALGLK